MNIIESIKTRRSVRTFKNIKLKAVDQNNIRAYLKTEENFRSPLEKSAVFSFASIVNGRLENGEKVGTYGFIRNPQSFIVSTCTNDRESIINTGYVLEKMILWLTRKGLGTCWLGGTFSRNTFAEAISLSEGSIIPAIIPLGYIEEKKRLFESLIRKHVKADNKMSWDKLFFREDFNTPLTEEDAQEWAVPLNMLRLGPSASNKQPWRVLVKKKIAYLYLQESPEYNHALGYEIQLLDMGIAMCHLELGAQESGMKGKWKFANPGIILSNTKMKFIASYQIVTS